ncbi:MAG TPA: carbamoyltransferase N-terminal domain-containing protein, partial [Gemmatimonadales bacterium]|nr:carbamoyltransferase N-terminal domain-containing protein [Gemmatimonadales bacterium]
MRVLGISAFYHDSAAALVEDGRVVAAAQEERFTRKKHDASFPRKAIAACLAEGSVKLDQVDYVAFYDKPFLKFERLLETYLTFAPKGFRSFAMAMPLWLKEKLFQRSLLNRELTAFSVNFDVQNRLLFSEHHQSHAASAFFASPFREAAVLTMDGVGEWATTSLGVGRDNKLEMVKEIHFPHSLGLLYSAFTYFTGFKVNSGEYKLMGLAPYGDPRYAKLILDHLIDVKADGSFRLDLDYFDYCSGLRMTSSKFHDLFGGPPRGADERLTPHHMDLAASIQAVTE